MLDSPNDTPILEWLDLYPELLSAGKRTRPGHSQPAVEPGLPVLEDGTAVAAISPTSVLSWGGAMTFHQTGPMALPPTLGGAGQAYRSPGRGGTQAEALAHLAGHLGHQYGW